MLKQLLALLALAAPAAAQITPAQCLPEMNPDTELPDPPMPPKNGPEDCNGPLPAGCWWEFDYAGYVDAAFDWYAAWSRNFSGFCFCVRSAYSTWQAHPDPMSDGALQAFIEGVGKCRTKQEQGAQDIEDSWPTLCLTVCEEGGFFLPGLYWGSVESLRRSYFQSRLGGGVL